MFAYDVTHWLTFFGAAILLTLAPGPDLAFILGQSISRGRQAGFQAMYGIWTGAFAHVFLAAAGLSAILSTSALAFSLVKWLGAAYLIWLGVGALRSDGLLQELDRPAPAVASPFKQGMLVAALNPKTAIFFLSFLPQFVEANAGPASLQLLLHGSLVIGVAVFIEPPAVIAGSALKARLQRNPAIGRWLDRGLGVLFISLGLRLALSSAN